MIVTFQEIVESQGWQQGQLAEVDIWIGRYAIRHINRVMFVAKDNIYVESDRYFNTEDKEEVKKDLKKVIDYSLNEYYTCARTLAEAIDDAGKIDSVIEEKRKTKIEGIKNTLLDGIKIIQDALSVKGYDDKDDAIDQLNNFQGDEFAKFRYLLTQAGYIRELPDVIDEEVVRAIRHIYSNHSFDFCDPNNNNILTWVNLKHAVSVETDFLYRGKECVRIEMLNNKSFDIYKDSEPALYMALYILYN